MEGLLQGAQTRQGCEVESPNKAPPCETLLPVGRAHLRAAALAAGWAGAGRDGGVEEAAPAEVVQEAGSRSLGSSGRQALGIVQASPSAEPAAEAQ